MSGDILHGQVMVHLESKSVVDGTNGMLLMISIGRNSSHKTLSKPTLGTVRRRDISNSSLMFACNFRK